MLQSVLKNERLDRWMFWLLCLLAVSVSLSVAATNVAIGLLVPLVLYRLWQEPPDWRSVLDMDRGLFIWLGLFLFSALLSTVTSPEIQKGAVTFANYYLYRMLPAAVVLLWIKEKKRLWILTGLVMASIFFDAVITIGQAIAASSLMGRRFCGLVGYMAQAGLLSAAVPLLALTVVWRGRRRWRFIGLLLLVVAIVALLLNGARGAWLAAAITTVTVLAFVVRDCKQYLAGLGLAVLVLGGIFTQVPHLEARLETLTQANYQSNSERLLMWRSAFRMFQDHPLLGVGTGHYSYAYRTQYILPEARERQQGHAHSNVMQMLAERGALGMVSFCGMWFYFIAFSLRGWLRTHEIAYLAFFAIVLGVMLQGLTEYNMGTVVVSKTYWFSLAIALQWIALTRKERSV